MLPLHSYFSFLFTFFLVVTYNAAPATAAIPKTIKLPILTNDPEVCGIDFCGVVGVAGVTGVFAVSVCFSFFKSKLFYFSLDKFV